VLHSCPSTVRYPTIVSAVPVVSHSCPIILLFLFSHSCPTIIMVACSSLFCCYVRPDQYVTLLACSVTCATSVLVHNLIIMSWLCSPFSVSLFSRFLWPFSSGIFAVHSLPVCSVSVLQSVWYIYLWKVKQLQRSFLYIILCRVGKLQSLATGISFVMSHSTATGCVAIYQCDDSTGAVGAAGSAGFPVFVCFCLFLLPCGLPCAAAIQSIAAVHHLR
jgi:hypothetical protein